MFSCCQCFQRTKSKYSCIANRNQDNYQIFDVSEDINEPEQTLSHDAITSLLFNFLVRELHSKSVRYHAQTFYLGSELNDDFVHCSMCLKKSMDRYMQYEINNRFFGNVWNGNLYVLQFVCLPCSKIIQPHLITTLKAVQHAYRQLQAIFVSRKLQEFKTTSQSRQRIVNRVLSFLPVHFLSMKTITYSLPPKRLHKRREAEDDLSIWMSEQIIF
jgi:hypothetical protein